MKFFVKKTHADLREQITQPIFEQGQTVVIIKLPHRDIFTDAQREVISTLIDYSLYVNGSIYVVDLCVDVDLNSLWEAITYEFGEFLKVDKVC